ncbi:dnaJ-like subfamily B member 1-like [Quillaja saponaria]|uniref:DnaJ-like subfamily B member 1-like n=1 Tax=Quillaja saponaria TaxID=32244 RepID=A0AAD7M190_QUISA|nr:dnaJ-like subfamily B member 1-like [Quillaja saponaria]
MGDHPPQTPRSPTLDLYGILGIPKTAALKDIGKAYKSLVTKWYTDKNSKPESEDKSTGRSHHQEDRISNCSDDPMTPMDNDLLHHHQQSLEDSWFLGPSFSSRTASTIASRRSRTPTPSPRCSSRTTSRRSITPTSRSRSGSQRGASETEFPAASLSRNTEQNL